MKFHQSKVINNLEAFKVAPTKNKLMRQHLDMFLVWKTIEYFKPKSLLEIGFFAGQTFGIMTESAGQDVRLTSVDIDFSKKNIYQQLFQNAAVDFLEVDSKQLALSGSFDFIHIDGNHFYDYVVNDINKCLPHMHTSSVLYMDDINSAGVNEAVEELLVGQHDFVPFMLGEQGAFFHHRSHSADHFLDTWIQDRSKNFMQFFNTDYQGFTVLRPSVQRVFLDMPDMFVQACEYYDL